MYTPVPDICKWYMFPERQFIFCWMIIRLGVKLAWAAWKVPFFDTKCIWNFHDFSIAMSAMCVYQRVLYLGHFH